jgi:sugar/nucleoside kinase (ribokinase family)
MSGVLCYGSLIADRVLRLPHFPRPGEGVHALSETLYLGGEPSNVGGQLAAWGVPVTIAGNNLGCDALGAFIRAQLERRANITLLARDDPAVQTPTCYIWTTPDGERTIVPSWPTPTGYTLPHARLLAEAALVSASVYGPGMAEMLALARQLGRPTAVADIAGPDDPRLPGAALVTASGSVLYQRHGVSAIEPWMRAVHATSGALVVVSDGAQPLLALSSAGWRRVQPPTIEPVDTTGAGDALKAGLILGWLRQWPLDQTLAWAVSAASLQCLRHGPCAEPTAETEVAQMLPAVAVTAPADGEI